jgi:uncharacterized protein (DUF433 family)
MTILPIEHIEKAPGRLREKIRIVGTVLTVDEIAAMHNNGCTVDWFLENYDDLTPAKVYAALSYYYDHKDEIDERNRWLDEYLRQHATPLSDLIEKGRKRLAEMRKESEG